MRVIFVCTGNTCRSPMAKFILKDALKRSKIGGVKVDSAGLMAHVGDEMAQNAQQALSTIGVKYSKHTAKQFTMQTLEKADLVLVMTEKQKQMIRRDLKVKSLSEIASCGDIPDPYGQDLNSYIFVANMLQSAILGLINTGYFNN